MVTHKLTREAVIEAVNESDICFRDGFVEIFELLARENVPTLIFSAGLYDVIHVVLNKEYAKLSGATPPPNVHVVSNMMKFDENGTLTGFEGKVRCSLN
jgi:2-hydroxy-3-keto-5-methylthiopentenyl-1-phosphate phosphatase